MSSGEGRECALRYHWRVRQGPDHIGHVAIVGICIFPHKEQNKLFKGFE